jgi:hypothetical protein
MPELPPRSSRSLHLPNFWISRVATNPEGIDKVNAALREKLKSSPLSGPAFGSMTDSKGHRDEQLRGEGTFK